MKKVAILGSTGMLGSALTTFMANGKFKVIEFNRDGRPLVPNNQSIAIDVTLSHSDLQKIFSVNKFDYVVNAIGAIKQTIDDTNSASVENAFTVNSDFPKFLNSYSLDTGTPIIQIGTDCVYSGDRGGYKESDQFDPNDVYGKSKVLGESLSQNTMILRCSIIGKEIKGNRSLLSWLLSQKYGATVTGYIDHYWNGITTLDFSKIVYGIIEKNYFYEGVSHVVPSDILNKYQLLKLIASAFGRNDLDIREIETNKRVNRSLATNFLSKNQLFWNLGGFKVIPTIDQMIKSYVLWAESNQSRI